MRDEGYFLPEPAESSGREITLWGERRQKTNGTSIFVERLYAG